MMAPGNPDKFVKSLVNKVNDLEERIKFIEHFMGMDEDAIKGAMEEKEDFPELEESTEKEEGFNYGNV